MNAKPKPQGAGGGSADSPTKPSTPVHPGIKIQTHIRAGGKLGPTGRASTQMAPAAKPSGVEMKACLRPPNAMGGQRPEHKPTIR